MTVTTNHWLRKATVFMLAFAPPSSQAAADGVFRTVALSGQRASGTADGVVYDKFNFGGKQVELNNLGQVAFYAELVGPGVTSSNNQGAWTEGRGTGLALLARDGDPAPGLAPGAVFTGSALFNLQINDTGVTAIGEHNPGFWSDQGTDVLELIARRRPAPVPGIENSVFDSFPERAVLNDFGRITIPAVIQGSPALVVHDPVEQYSVLFAAIGGQAPDLAEGILLDSSPVTNLIAGHETNSGHYFLVSRLVGPGVNAINDRAFWVTDGAGNLQLTVREGDQAPALPGGIVISSFSHAVNDVGQFAFSGNLTGSGVNSTNNVGLWVGDSINGPQLVMRSGGIAPGAEDGAAFGTMFFSQPPTFNNLRQIVFNAPLTGAGVLAGNDSGVWSTSGGTGLRLVAREGDPAPGADLGQAFGELYAAEEGQLNRLNNLGQVAFFGRLTGPGVTQENNAGIWAHDRDGALHLIIRTGDVLDVDNGPGLDSRTVRHLGTLRLPGITNEIQPGLQINDIGQIEFEAIFTDGSSGVFVSNAIAQSASDFNDDGVVDGLDLASWKTGFGTSGDAAFAQGDADGDRDIDGADFLAWQRQIGKDLPAAGNSATVPEPATLPLFALAGTAQYLLRRWDVRGLPRHRSESR